MSSQKVVDLRKRKVGSHFRLPLPLHGPEHRRPSLRSRRRRTRSIIALGVLALFAGAAYGVSWLSYLPRLSVQSVAVSGTKEVRPSLVSTYVETQLFDGSYPFLSRTNLFLYPRASIERGLVDFFPRIRSVSISRESLLAQAITVAVEEREPYARWCRGDECFLLDDGGFIFANTATSTSALKTHYVFTGGIATSTSPIGQRFLSGRLTGVLALLDRLGQAGWNAESVAVKNEQDFEVRLSATSGSGKNGSLPAGRQGFSLRASFGNDGEAVVKNLELVLSADVLRGRESELEYVDLRFGNRVYYKLKGAEQQSTE